MESVTENLACVRERIASAAAKSGRKADEIELVAVSKTHPPETVRQAVEAGQLVYGESRVQEAKAKIPLLPGRLRWHFIGHLQKNKIRSAMPLFDLFHGVDSLEAAQEMNRLAQDAGVWPRILLEVNVAGESSKFGFSPARLPEQMEALSALDHLEIRGLMAMAPFHPDAEHARPYFARTRELRERLARESGAVLQELSMGMSGDYGVAIEEGATMVRVGSAIFGPRSGKAWRPEATEGE